MGGGVSAIINAGTATHAGALIACAAGGIDTLHGSSGSYEVCMCMREPAAPPRKGPPPLEQWGRKSTLGGYQRHVPLQRKEEEEEKGRGHSGPRTGRPEPRENST